MYCVFLLPDKHFCLTWSFEVRIAHEAFNGERKIVGGKIP